MSTEPKLNPFVARGDGARLALAIAASIGVAWLGAGCGAGDAGGADERAANGAAAPAGKITNVEVLVVTPTSFTSVIALTGTVAAENDAVVSAEETGTVTAYLVDKGAHVKEGDRIAQLDDRLLRAQVAEARAAAALARERYERQERLWNEERIGSELTFLEARAATERADATLEGLQTRLGRTAIRAPFDGVFDAKYVEVGEMAAPGTRIARVVSNRRLKVVAGVPERFAPHVREEALARITFDVLPGVVVEQPVSFVGAAVDEQNRTFTIEVPIPSPDASIKPAMVATVKIATSRADDRLVVPQNAVSRTENGFQVFVAERDGEAWRARARSVVLGPSKNNQVVVESGLEPGTRLITLGRVDAGDAIRILTEHASLETIDASSGL